MRDLLIVGGGPAGLVTALHARRAGLSVTVLEPRPAPIEKACGEGLLPPGVQALLALGLGVPGYPLRGITYCDARYRVSADFAGEPGRGVLRTDLHRLLHRAAVAAGVEVAPVRVRELRQDAGAVHAGGLSGRYLVGADGLHSLVRRLVGAELPAGSAPGRYGIRAHFATAPWTDRVEVHWAAGSEAYVTPVADDLVGVALLGGRAGGLADRLAHFPQLAARLPAEPLDRPRGAGPLRQDVRHVVAGRVLLVGDAAGYVDALTGEGLAQAFRCAGALVRRVLEDRPEAYAHDHSRITRRYRTITGALVAAGARPRLRAGIVPASVALPGVFRAAVGQLAR